MSRRQLQRIGIFLGLLLAFGLRFYRLGDQNLWWDEGLSILATRQSLLGATLWTAGDVHPPLYFWILWFWARLTGESEFALRAITALISFLTVALLVPLGRRLGGQKTALLAVWLLALSRFHIWWAQEMRMYTLAGFCVLLSTYCLIRILTQPRTSWKDWLAWGGATAAALYTIYATITLLLIQNLIVLGVGLWRRSERWALWKHWVLAQAGVAAVVLAWLAVALPRMHSWSVVREPASLGSVLLLDNVLLILGISTDIGRYGWVVGAWLLVMGIGIGLRWRQSRAEPAPLPLGSPGLSLGTLGSGWLLPPLVVWLLTQPRALFYTPRVEARYLLPWAGFFYLLLAWALIGWGRSRGGRWIGGAVGVALMGVMVAVLPQYYESRYLRDTLQTLTRTVWAHARPGDGVWLVSGDRYPIFLSYYDRPEAPGDRPAVELVPHSGQALSAESAAAVLDPLVAGHSRIWLAQVERNLQDPQGVVEQWLSTRYSATLQLAFDYNRLTLFEIQSGVPRDAVTTLAPQHPAGESLPELGILGYDLPAREFRPGDRVRLGLYLQPFKPVTLTVRLLGAAGEAGRVHLSLEPGGTDPVIRRLVEFEVTPFTPPGPYRFGLSTVSASELVLGGAQIVDTERAPDPEAVPHPFVTQVGDSIRFLGYGLRGVKAGDPPLAYPGDTLILELYWQSPEPLPERYTVFTHLLGTAYNPSTQGPVWAQLDQEPVGGAYPTTSWLPNLPLRDEYRLVIPPDAPAGDYQLEVGMYRLVNGERLPVTGTGADPALQRILLTSVRVIPRP